MKAKDSFGCRAALAAVLVSVVILPVASAQAPKRADGAVGTIEKIKVHGKSLEGNLEGDSPDRDVFVYLPPSYGTQKNRKYPVVYFLHGYNVTAEAYWKLMTVPAAMDKSIADGAAKEMILVHPDSFTVYNGSMYSN